MFIAIIPPVFDYEHPKRLRNERFLAHSGFLANAGNLEI
jgi:hypothetical protein